MAWRGVALIVHDACMLCSTGKQQTVQPRDTQHDPRRSLRVVIARIDLVWALFLLSLPNDCHSSNVLPTMGLGGPHMLMRIMEDVHVDGHVDGGILLG